MILNQNKGKKLNEKRHLNKVARIYFLISLMGEFLKKKKFSKIKLTKKTAVD